MPMVFGTASDANSFWNTQKKFSGNGWDGFVCLEGAKVASSSITNGTVLIRGTYLGGEHYWEVWRHNSGVLKELERKMENHTDCGHPRGESSWVGHGCCIPSPYLFIEDCSPRAVYLDNKSFRVSHE